MKRIKNKNYTKNERLFLSNHRCLAKVPVKVGFVFGIHTKTFNANCIFGSIFDNVLYIGPDGKRWNSSSSSKISNNLNPRLLVSEKEEEDPGLKKSLDLINNRLVLMKNGIIGGLPVDFMVNLLNELKGFDFYNEGINIYNILESYILKMKGINIKGYINDTDFDNYPLISEVIPYIIRNSEADKGQLLEIREVKIGDK